MCRVYIYNYRVNRVNYIIVCKYNKISTYNTNCVIDNWWCKTYARQKIKILYQKATENKENLTFMKGNVLAVLWDLPSSLLQHDLVCASKCRLQRVLHASYLGPAETGAQTHQRAAEVTLFRTRTTRRTLHYDGFMSRLPWANKQQEIQYFKKLS